MGLMGGGLSGLDAAGAPRALVRRRLGARHDHERLHPGLGFRTPLRRTRPKITMFEENRFGLRKERTRNMKPLAHGSVIFN